MRAGRSACPQSFKALHRAAVETGSAKPTGSAKRKNGGRSRKTPRLGHLGNENPYNRRDPNRWLNYVTIQLYLGLRFVFITQVLPDGVFFQHHPTDDGEV